MQYRSDRYIDTISTSDPQAQKLIDHIRKTILTVNRMNREKARYTGNKPEQFFIRVRGRLGRNNPNAYLYAKGGINYRPFSQDIKLEHASRVDVYFGVRR